MATGKPNDPLGDHRDPNDGSAEEAALAIKAALVAVTLRPGGAPPALTAALADRSPARRAVAAAVLGRDGEAYLKGPGRRLYLAGLKQPMKITAFRDGQREMTFTVLELHYYNRFDDKESAKP
jgi:hypothetical protein